MSHGKHDSHALGHVVSFKTTTTILICLLVLTAITVFIAQIDFGEWNIVVAMAIASLKASLVIMFFMHGRYENRILWIYILIPFILVAVMLAGVFIDNPFRINATPVQVQVAK